MIHIIEQFKQSLLMLKVIHILTMVKKLMLKILNFKLVIMQKQKHDTKNTETFLLKIILQAGLKKFLESRKLEIVFHGPMLLMILMVKKLLEDFI